MKAQMQPHQQRVVDEKSELDDKLSLLNDFIEKSPVFLTLDYEERVRLDRQSEAMTVYSDILAERIAAF